MLRLLFILLTYDTEKGSVNQHTHSIYTTRADVVQCNVLKSNISTCSVTMVGCFN